MTTALKRMQRQAGAGIALQIVANLPYDDINCFTSGRTHANIPKPVAVAMIRVTARYGS